MILISNFLYIYLFLIINIYFFIIIFFYGDWGLGIRTNPQSLMNINRKKDFIYNNSFNKFNNYFIFNNWKAQPMVII